MEDPFHRPGLSVGGFYRDPRAALEWLAAGARILREPADQFYGDRTYSAQDPEGHVWSFAQVIRLVSRQEAEQASGLKIEGWS